MPVWSRLTRVTRVTTVTTVDQGDHGDHGDHDDHDDQGEAYWTNIEAQVRRERLLLCLTESMEWSSFCSPRTYWYMYFQKATENSSVYTGIY